MSAPGSYHRPTCVRAALEVLAFGGWRVAAGCTDLFPATERKVLEGPILDISGIAELRGISRSGSGIRIGATTTWSDLIRAELPPAFHGLKLAAREVGAMQIQNRGTVAGNLCNASPAADGVPPLLTLDAQVEVRSADATRCLPLQDFICGPRRTALGTGEMVTAVLVPDAATGGSAHFKKLGAREYLVISIAMTAARIVVRDGIVVQAALAVGSCGPAAVRLGEIERQMTGLPLDAERITDAAVAAMLHPIDDIRADAAYRASGAAELMRRTIRAIAAMDEPNA